MTDTKDKLIKNILNHLSKRGIGINELNEITSHIYLTNYENSINVKLMKKHNISIVINASGIIKDGKILERYTRESITNIDLYFDVESFDSAYNIIIRAIKDNRIVCIACEHGQVFSPALIAYYFMRRYYILRFEDAKKSFQCKSKMLRIIDTDIEHFVIMNIILMIKSLRPCITLNESLIELLVNTEINFKEYFAGLVRAFADDNPEYHILSSDESSEDGDTLLDVKVALTEIKKK